MSPTSVSNVARASTHSSDPKRDSADIFSDDTTSQDTSINIRIEESTGLGTLIDTNGNEFTVPDFNINDLLRAIPKHCFEKSTLRGFSYISRDFACLSITFFIWHTYVTPEYIPQLPIRVALWTVYTVIQGLVGTGLWIIGHECGHYTIAESRFLNDLAGWVVHSLLLVPYFSWKTSHRSHHTGNGHMERDMAWVPPTREEYDPHLPAGDLAELAEDTPIYSLAILLATQLTGWPNYLFTNATGHNRHERNTEGRGKGRYNGLGGGVNHFDPRSPIFKKDDAWRIIASDIGILGVGTLLYYIGQRFGWVSLLVWYFIPYLWVNHWIVAITFLQHTDPSLPRYTGNQWTFVRGAAVTIDRDFGFIGRHMMHHITDTHVLHHYVSSIPFYHAAEATEAIKPVMGKHYRCDSRSGFIRMFEALYVLSRTCQWVEPGEGAKGGSKNVLFFRNRNGLGAKPFKNGKLSTGVTAEQHDQSFGKEGASYS